MAISCDKLNEILSVISHDHNISLDNLLKSLNEKNMLPKKMIGIKPSVVDEGVFDNKRAAAFAADNNISIEGIVGTGRNGRITIADMKKTAITASNGGKVKISAAAAKLATEHNIDINKITPSGKRGDILLKDVKEAIDNQPQELVIEEPEASDEEPEASDEEPEASDEEPEASDEEPEASDEEPEASDEEPEASDEEPELDED